MFGSSVNSSASLLSSVCIGGGFVLSGATGAATSCAFSCTGEATSFAFSCPIGVILTTGGSSCCFTTLEIVFESSILPCVVAIGSCAFSEVGLLPCCLVVSSTLVGSSSFFVSIFGSADNPSPSFVFFINMLGSSAFFGGEMSAFFAADIAISLSVVSSFFPVSTESFSASFSSETGDFSLRGVSAETLFATSTFSSSGGST
mmetsp:Transcript_19400/g.35129  ORF Transcript_19400/g.35129 Transcript_19400/m.35129 type:complete len:202 (+) Transcript_19400:2185-2790(+)